MMTGAYDTWGGSPADMCTSNSFYGCERNAAASGNYINPVMSARVRTVESFNFKYGRVEVKAQLPQGDWIWPAIWMLPKHNEFGNWPASGEIDIVESRGNGVDCSAGGSNTFGSTLHFGPAWDQDPFEVAHADYVHPTSLGDEMHTYGLLWTKDRIQTYIDDPSNLVLDLDMTDSTFWEKGNFADDIKNPW